MRLPLAASLLAALVFWGGVGAAAGAPRVVTDIPPVQSLVAQVMGGLGAPEVLLSQGEDPHDMQLRPSQAAALGRADLLFWIGPQLTPGIARAIAGIGLRGKSVQLIAAPGTFTMPFTTGDGATPGALNPHVWLDPDNARAWLKVIAADLSAADPAHAAAYAANASAADRAVAQADNGARHLLAPVGNAPLVMFHDAFAYYARHFGLDIAGAIELGDAAMPGAARLNGIRALLEARGASACVFPEAGHDSRLVHVVAEGTGARIGTPLDPAGTLLPPGPGLYAALIEGVARNIKACVAP